MLIVLSGFFMPAFSKQDTTYAKKTYTTAETQLSVDIDGWINEEAWQAVPWRVEKQPKCQASMMVRNTTWQDSAWAWLRKAASLPATT